MKAFAIHPYDPPEAAGSVFAELPVTPRTHFRLHFFAAVYRVIDYLQGLDGVGGRDGLFEKFSFLAGYHTEILRYMPAELPPHERAAWWDGEVAAWEQRSREHLPLRALIEQAHLPPESRLAFMIVGLVEEDSRFGTLFGDVQAPLVQRRPCLELVGRIVAGDRLTLDAWGVCQPLLARGLVEVLAPAAPRSEWTLNVPGILWDAARGVLKTGETAGGTFHEAEALPSLSDLIFPESFLDKIAQIPHLVNSGKVEAVILRGSRGSERLAVMGAVARLLGLGLIEVESEHLAKQARLLRSLCTMTRALPVITYDFAPGETADVPRLPGYHGPMGFLLGAEGGLRGGAVEKVITLPLAPLKASERLRCWQKAFGGFLVEGLDEINERFFLPGGYIRQAASAAIAHAALEGRTYATARDVRVACRTLNRQLLDSLADHLEVDEALADRLEADGAWAHLIVSDATWHKLCELEQRCRHRERLLGHLGPAFGGGVNRGVRALFTGPSGTGKTLAAKIMAAKLGLDLYRVDLAAVVNKYIGETEKNLHRVFTTAEELDVILLLDEGDALLGGRTEVKSSNDRYANLETNYLLQRLEHYQGIVLVTTNLGENIDRAFQRRMDVAVDFLPPGVEERWHIWRLHLPAQHAVGAAFLEGVAIRCKLNGGQIRNAALLATLLALDDGSPLVEAHHLEEAIRSEYKKAGGTFPLETRTQVVPRQGKVEAFLNALS